MKRISILIFTFFWVTNTFSQKSSLCNETLVDYLGNTLDNSKLNHGVTVFLITSYTCGPCIQSIPKYDRLKTEFPQVNFIGILDNDSTYISNFKKLHGKEFWFPKIVDTDLKLSEKYWKKQVWPEYHIYKNGQLVKRLVDASDKTFNSLTTLIKKLEN
jgi:thiol-disulfide isomerase/thioredoxin